MKEQPVAGQPRVTEYTSEILPSLEEADIALQGPRGGWMMLSPLTPSHVPPRSGVFLREPCPKGPEPLSVAGLGLPHLMEGWPLRSPPAMADPAS